MKELFGQIKPVYLIAAAVVVVLALIVGGILIFTGGDDDAPDGPDPRLGVGEGDATQLPGSRRAPREAPRVRTGVVDTLDGSRAIFGTQLKNRTELENMKTL